MGINHMGVTSDIGTSTPTNHSPGVEEPNSNVVGRPVVGISKRLRPGLCLAVVIAGLVALYIDVMNPNSFGYGNDDAIYLTAAKSLATGQGYRQISLPYQPPQTRYPPVYPGMLSLVWRASSNFPGNLTAVMLLSVLASAAALILAWVYLSKYGYVSQWTAVVIVGLAGLNAHTVICSTTTIPEMQYTALSIGALILAEARKRNEDSWTGGWRGGLLLGVLIGLASLSRVAGITLALAVLIYFLSGKNAKKAVLPLFTASLFIVSWIVWTLLNRSTFDEPNAIYHTNYLRYSYELIKNAQMVAGNSFLSAMWAVIRHNLIAMAYSTPLESLGYNYDWFGGPNTNVPLAATVLSCLGLVVMALGIREQCRRRWRLMAIYALLYLLLIVLLPFPDNSYERYLVPVLPFLMCFLATGLWSLARIFTFGLAGSVKYTKRIAAGLAAAPLAPLVVACLLSYSHCLYWISSSLKDAFGKSMAQDAPAMMWINENTTAGDVLACVRHARYYLYTGRQSALCFPTLRSSDDQRSGTTASESVLQILRQNRADYFILTSWDVVSRAGGIDYPDVLKQLADLGMLAPVFQSPDGRSAVFKVLPDAFKMPSPG